MRRLLRSDEEPGTLVRLKASADQSAETQYLSGVLNLSFRSHVYGADDVRQSLQEFHHDKCAYCEAALAPVTVGHVEHVRPKGAIVNETTKQTILPGYFWLAYEWTNLLLGCPSCNGKSSKGNRFPLYIEGDRATPTARSTSNERPLLIDPTVDHPRRHIRFRGEVAYASQGSTRGNATINILGLNSENLRKSRKQHLDVVYLLRFVRDTIGNHEEKVKAELLLNEFESEKGKFFSCIKDFFHLTIAA